MQYGWRRRRCSGSAAPDAFLCESACETLGSTAPAGTVTGRHRAVDHNEGEGEEGGGVTRAPVQRTQEFALSISRSSTHDNREHEREFNQGCTGCGDDDSDRTLADDVVRGGSDWYSNIAPGTRPHHTG